MSATVTPITSGLEPVDKPPRRALRVRLEEAANLVRQAAAIVELTRAQQREIADENPHIDAEVAYRSLGTAWDLLDRADDLFCGDLSRL